MASPISREQTIVQPALAQDAISERYLDELLASLDQRIKNCWHSLTGEYIADVTLATSMNLQQRCSSPSCSDSEEESPSDELP